MAQTNRVSVSLSATIVSSRTTHEQQARKDVEPKGGQHRDDDVSEDGIGEEITDSQVPISRSSSRNIADRLESEEVRGELREKYCGQDHVPFREPKYAQSCKA